MGNINQPIMIFSEELFNLIESFFKETKIKFIFTVKS
jgi:hypothetical protein